jgi:class 3 adenylate cyclase
VPAQTRAFLFSDLRGYSAYTERRGDRAARELLGRYRRVVREVIGTFNGAEIRTEGDSFYVVFASVSDAVQGGLAILASLERERADQPEEPINVGIGIHAGESEDSEEGIVSGAVNVAARICAQAQSGELLVSDTVRALTRTYMDVRFQPRGRRRLKGIGDPIALYRAAPVAEGVPRGDQLAEGDSRRWLMRGGIAIAGAAAVLTVAIVGGTLLRESAAFDLSGPPLGESESTGASGESEGDSSAPSTPAGASSSPAGSPSAAALGPYPTDAELALLADVDLDASACVRADTDEIPTAPHPHQPTYYRPDVEAAVRCPLAGGMNVYYFKLIASIAADPMAFGKDIAEEIVLSLAGRREISAGACTAETPALELWEFGDSKGRLLCDPGHQPLELFWTYDGSNLLGKADGREFSRLLEWWNDHARFAAGPPGD